MVRVNTQNSIGNIFLSWVVHMCDMATVGEKSNVLEPRNSIFTVMTSALDLWTPNSIANIFLPWVVHMQDMVTLRGKCNVLDSGNHSIYRRMDNSIPVKSCGGITQCFFNIWDYFVIQYLSKS
jgi:hypothetical protein